jgi:PadR family transcriptional regulator, regulatory protein PadR
MAAEPIPVHESMEEHSKLFRDLLLGFVKVHVLHHASREAIYGVGISNELERHGYRLSPGTLYPLLHGLEAANFLVKEDRVVGGKVRKYYRITRLGQRALEEARSKIVELVNEVTEDEAPTRVRRRAAAGGRSGKR